MLKGDADKEGSSRQRRHRPWQRLTRHAAGREGSTATKERGAESLQERCGLKSQRWS